MRRKLIPVYKEEVQAGLKDKIRASASIAYTIRPTIDQNPNKEAALKTKAVQLAIAENKGQPDLFYLRDILVTADATSSNGNDDVFLPEEVYAARHTPEDKPFNLGHEALDIIGHITAQQLMGTDGSVIADDILLDDLPSKYHVVNNTVIYKFWPEEKRQEQIDTIIAEIEKGDKWFVSMEAVFSNFDYGILKGTELEIVPRDKATAFLTKYLRVYGGDGTYQNNRILRVLRDFVFSGKGLVENPANLESVIESNNQQFFIKNSQVLEKNGYVLNSKHDKEKVQMNELEQLKAQLATEQAARAEAEKQLKAINEKELQLKIDGLTAKIKDQDTKIAELNTGVKASNELAEKSNKAQSDAEVSLKDANDKLAKIEAEKVEAARIATIQKDLGADEAQAKKLYATVAKLDAESFKNFVASAPKFTVAKTETETKTSKTKEDIAALEKAEAEKKGTGAVGTEQNSDLQKATTAFAKLYSTRNKK